ncbi:hypothetical protein C9994_00455 [Marivirga lumbricoides]|uniref:Uncharacterized protein n=1 Tax=Marivirga lumbricoides TaxID=1046115 RepID=A0A2T4DVT9_9BACT|nr:hypothetical protein C9994_00455 [Marivirga lumbricoides]
MRVAIVFAFTFFLYGINPALGQSDFPFFEETNSLPKNLLNERSVVFMNVKNLDWEVQANIIHKYFKEEGVDAVAYYALSDILSGHDATNSFYRDINSRSIDNLIIVHQTNSGYSLFIAQIPDDGNFFKKGMPAYQLMAPGLKELGISFTNRLEQSDLERNNFLIIDVPEVFKRTNVIKSRRVESFNADIRIDKLAVPMFQESVMMTENVENANQQLDSIMKEHYPFRYGIVRPNITDEEMIAQGYLMVLRKLENNGESLKRMLGYQLSDDETIYISVRKGPLGKVSKFSKGETVHKYYVQQLYTKDIYLGPEWDADTTWQKALINHAENIKEALKDK